MISYPVGMSYKLEVFDRDGNLVSTVCKDLDLATNNWTTWFKALIENVTLGGTTSISLANTSNQTRSLRMRQNTTASASVWSNTGSTSQSSGVRLCIGDGNGTTVTPVRTNFALVRELSTGQASANSGAGVVTFARSFANGSGATWTVREVGLKMAMFQESTSTTEDFLMFHDTVTPTTVNDGSAITLTYNMTWP
jgi:hypothetical protein